MFQQGGENPLHRRHGLPLGKNHLREPATAAAVQVDLGVAQVGGHRPAGPADELLDGKFARQHLGGQLFNISVSMIPTQV